MANAGPFIPCPIANAGQCCRIAVLRTLRGDGSRRTDQPAIRPTQVLYGSRNRNLLTPDYWTTPAEKRRNCAARLKQPFRSAESAVGRLSWFSAPSREGVCWRKTEFPWSKNDALSSASRSLATALWRAASTNEIRTDQRRALSFDVPDEKSRMREFPPCSRYGNIAIRYECG